MMMMIATLVVLNRKVSCEALVHVVAVCSAGIQLSVNTCSIDIIIIRNFVSSYF